MTKAVSGPAPEDALEAARSTFGHAICRVGSINESGVQLIMMWRSKLRDAWKAEDPVHRYSLVLLVTAGAATRLAFLFQPIRGDEGLTYFLYASKPLWAGMTNYAYPNNHLFSTLLIHFSTRMFGSGVAAIRLPAFIAGVLVVPVTYLVFRKLYNKWIGLMAAALVVPSFLLVSYSTDGRGYSIQTLACLALILIALRLKRMRSGWTAFVVVSALAFFTLPTSLYFFGALVIWMLLSALAGDVWEDKRTFVLKLAIACLATVGLTLLLYLPLILNSGLSVLTANPWFSPQPLGAFMQGAPGRLAEAWTSWHLGFPLLLVVMVTVGFLAAIVFHRKVANDRVNFPLVITLWSFALFFAQRTFPFVRTWLPLLPLYLGFASAGIYYLGSRLAGFLGRLKKIPRFGATLPQVILVTLSVFLCFMLYASQYPYQTEDSGLPALGVFRDVKNVTAALKPHLKPGDVIIAEQEAVIMLEYYFLREGIPLGYLHTNVNAAEVSKSLRRIFAVEGFGEGHSLTAAARFMFDITEARLFKGLESSRIFIVRLKPIL